jgi:hypothetical protein
MRGCRDARMRGCGDGRCGDKMRRWRPLRTEQLQDAAQFLHRLDSHLSLALPRFAGRGDGFPGILPKTKMRTIYKKRGFVSKSR